jgi:glucokinase
MILAGDIGGTNVRLALYAQEGATLRMEASLRLVSAELSGLHEAVDQLRNETGEPSIEAACFGVAGRVEEGRAALTNLPWLIDEGELSEALGGVPVRVRNDLEVTAIGLIHLPPAGFRELLPGEPPSHPGNRAVIAAGTGLGQAMLVWDGTRYVAVATEGGHAGFAPRTAVERALAQAIAAEGLEHVSVERVLSGDGLSAIYDFLAARGEHRAAPHCDPSTADDRNRAIADAGLDGRCRLCRASLALFCTVYGAEAGNLALRALTRSGIYLAGGIAPQILPALRGPEFRESFLEKGRFRSFMEKVPVHVCIDTEAALLGAAYAATGR